MDHLPVKIRNFVPVSHNRSIAFDPEVLLATVDARANLRDYFIPPVSADFSRLDIAGIPRYGPVAAATNAVTDLTAFQVGLTVVRTAIQ
jgi:hypothetical protein